MLSEVSALRLFDLLIYITEWVDIGIKVDLLDLFRFNIIWNFVISFNCYLNIFARIVVDYKLAYY